MVPIQIPAIEVLADKHKVGGDQQGAEQPFKKLNPYAAIPLVTAANEARYSFHDSQSAILQSADGSKRMEIYKGMCYKIDYNGVMGKVGLPQGLPR